MFLSGFLGNVNDLKQCDYNKWVSVFVARHNYCLTVVVVGKSCPETKLYYYCQTTIRPFHCNNFLIRLDVGWPQPTKGRLCGCLNLYVGTIALK